MRVIFFLKMFKIESKLRKYKKNLEKIFRFWKCCYKLSLLRRKYLLLAVNGLTNSPKILHIIKTDFLTLNCLYWDQQFLERCCRSDFHRVLACLPCPLSKGSLKWEFLDIYLTTYFEVRKFKYTSAMRVILFSKMFKIESKFRKLKKKEKTNEKLFFVSATILSENVPINSLC